MIAGGTTFYLAALARLVRRRVVVVAVFLAGLAATVWVYRIVPTGFVPDEDQNFIIMQLQGPDGASLDHSTKVAQAGRAGVEAGAGGARRVLGHGLQLRRAVAEPRHDVPQPPPNRGAGASRARAQAVVGRLRGALAQIPGAQVMPFLPPALAGVGTLGGFQFELLDQTGGHIANLARTMKEVVGQGNRRPELRGLFSTFSASDPQFAVDIDREKLKSLGMPLSEVSDTLQILLGSQYVNDFDFNNRAYRVYLQADRQFRAAPQAIEEFYVRSGSGEMLPLSSLVTHPRRRGAAGDQPFQHVPLGRDQRVGRAGLQLGTGARDDGERSRRACCRRVSRSSGPGSRSKS